jgi:aspartate kinase
MLVMKFGGACFATPERTRAVARRIAAEPLDRVIVVSAREGVTDMLGREFALAGRDDGAAERDLMLATGELQSAALLAATLKRVDVDATVILPWQLVRTTRVHGNAVITSVRPNGILAALSRGSRPIVPGFVGATDHGAITTLGRGGTDYTAVAIAAVLRCPVTLFKADVDGIYSSDPHRDASATRFDTLTHEDALSLARDGARVLHDKAAELALEAGVTIHVAPAFGDGVGTLIHTPLEMAVCVD